MNDRVVFRLFMVLLVILVAGWAFKLFVGIWVDKSLPVDSVRL